MRSFLTNILFYISLYGIRASCETREFHFSSFSMASTISLNVANFVTLQLTPKNYPLWREQMLALAESQDMVGLLTSEKIKPTMYINVTTERTSTSEATEQLSRPESRIHDGHIDKVPLQGSIPMRTQTYTQIYPNSIRVQRSINNKINFII